MSKFPKVLAAVKASEKGQWDIGDALLAECGEPGGGAYNDGSRERLEAAATEILEAGYDGFDGSYLSKLRQVAFDFPRRARISGVSWAAHLEAQTSEFLNAVVAKARGKKVTRDFVLAVRAQVQEREAAKRKAAYAKAEEERKEAQAEEERARKKAQAARDKEERAAAQEEARRARDRKEAARAAARSAKAAPKKGKPAPPTDEDLDAAALREIVFRLGKDAGTALLMARAWEKLAARYVNDIKPVHVNALREHALTAMNAWQKAAMALGRGSKTDRLAVVGE